MQALRSRNLCGLNYVHNLESVIFCEGAHDT